MERRAFGAVRVELLDGVDACSAAVVKLLLGWIRSGLICCAWFGTPCSSWSRARRDINGHGPRTRQHIWGVPGLSDAERHRLALGNATLGVTVQLIRALHSARIPCILENPAASYLWQAPPLAPLLALGQRVVIDDCSYGTRWRKRTAFHCWHLAAGSSLQCTCRGRRGNCSFSKRPHQLLSGFDKETKQRWTKIAEPYPQTLCSDFSRVCAETVENRQLHSHHIVLSGHRT